MYLRNRREFALGVIGHHGRWLSCNKELKKENLLETFKQYKWFLLLLEREVKRNRIKTIVTLNGIERAILERRRHISLVERTYL